MMFLALGIRRNDYNVEQVNHNKGSKHTASNPSPEPFDGKYQ